MSEKRRFHPLALAIYFLKSLKGWFFLFVIIFLRLADRPKLMGLAITGGILLLFLAAFFHYLSESYQLSSEKIVIYKGIFRKSEVDISYERIQTIKQRQWFFLQPFHITQIMIETAGGAADKAEASLVAVPESLLLEIENYRNQKDTEKAPTSKAVPEYIYQVTNQQIFLFALTDLNILLAAFTLLLFLQEIIPEKWLDKGLDVATDLLKAGWVVMLAFLMVVIIMLMIIALIKNFLQYYDFQVSRNKDTLTIESGLMERRLQKIPLEKIQGIRIKQQVFRKLLGLSTVQLILAGGQENEGEENAKELYFLPIVSDQQVYQVLDFLLPEWDFNPPMIQQTSKNHLLYFWRWPLLLVIPALLVGVFLHFLAGIACGGVIVLILIASYLDCRYQGYQIQGESRLCLQKFSFLTKSLTFIEKSKIQAFSEQTSPWLYPKKIGFLEIAIKEGAMSLPLRLRYMDLADIHKLQHFFKQR